MLAPVTKDIYDELQLELRSYRVFLLRQDMHRLEAAMDAPRSSLQRNQGRTVGSWENSPVKTDAAEATVWESTATANLAATSQDPQQRWAYKETSCTPRPLGRWLPARLAFRLQQRPPTPLKFELDLRPSGDLQGAV